MLDLGNRTSIYQPEQEGLVFPAMPEFENVEAERQHRKERLVAACRAFAQQGFDYGFAGTPNAPSCTGQTRCVFILAKSPCLT